MFYQLDSLNLDNNPLNDNGMKWLQKIMTDNPDFVLTMNGGSASYQGDNGQAIAITGQTGADYVAQEAQSLQDEYTSLQIGVMNALASLSYHYHSTDCYPNSMNPVGRTHFAHLTLDS